MSRPSPALAWLLAAPAAAALCHHAASGPLRRLAPPPNSPSHQASPSAPCGVRLSPEQPWFPLCLGGPSPSGGAGASIPGGLLTALLARVDDANPSSDPIPADGAATPSTEQAPVHPGLSAEALAKLSQNPVANLISVPFQYNANFGFGPDDDVQSVLNIQPVIPFSLGDRWNLITRTILPVIYQPTPYPGADDEFGIGDITLTTFLSPQADEGFIWGAGPAFLIPTATASTLGQGKFGIGPSVVGLYIKGPWVVGALANNIWSVAGSEGRPDVNQMLVQPFVNYNFPHGWFLTTSPIIIANWEADSDERWTVPIGGGFGRVFHLGRLPLSMTLQGYWNAERPDPVGEWTLRFQVSLLFPR